MHLAQAEQELNQQLATVYETAEAAAIANLVMHEITGLSRMQRRLAKEETMSTAQRERLERMVVQLLQHRPVQYVIGKAWFYNMELVVNEAVLIPRPETEELVSWVLEEKEKRNAPAILDIGTGSGCIPVALKKNWTEANVHAMDVSKEALAVAGQNAALQGADVHFIACDILDAKQWPAVPFDIIISNPPYIPKKESQLLDKNVTDWEPHLALFVPDNDPLLFYRIIAAFALEHLNPNGSLYFECHQHYAADVVNMLIEKGFRTELKEDLFGNERMVKAVPN